MTEEARKLAEENEKLIMGFANAFHVDLDANEDFYGMLAESFCKACEKYTPEVGKFSTFAYKYMSTTMKRFYQTCMQHKYRVNYETKMSLDYKPNDDKDGEYYNLVGVHNFEDEVCEKIDAQTVIKDIWEVATDIQRDYLENTYKGLTNKEIADKHSVKPQVISERRKELRKRITKLEIVYD